MKAHKRRVAIMAAILGAFMIGHAVGEPVKPYCPTEDSCVIDYRNGEFHVTEGNGR